jgi:F-type H+-transporting ATPase subunit b
MGFDWFTLIAQVVNFLVLVWLLKHFLYTRIVQAMNDRKAKITSRLEAAAQERAEVEREADLFRTKNRELDERRDEILARAKEEAEAHRERLMEATRLETEAAQAQWLESLQRERQALLQDVRERLGQQVFALARHALKELANAELEGQILKVFVERLQNLDPAEREAIVAAVRDSDREVELRTAFPVLPEARKGLTRSLRQQLDDSVDVRFTTVPELICGIELRAHSHRLVWNLDSYLEGLEARVFEVLDERAKKDAEPP